MDSKLKNLLVTIGEVYINKNKPLKERMKALFTLKHNGSEVAIDWIEKGFHDDSVLLKHEAAYCLGQMENSYANPILKKLLSNKNEDPMVRHEAAEALGAIGSKESIGILTEYLNDDVPVVVETCQIALERIEFFKNNKKSPTCTTNPFMSVDPAPPLKGDNIETLKAHLINENETLFTRYRAMFALRNINTSESAVALAEGLKYGSALFKHEIAYVLGQLRDSSPEVVQHLKETLENGKESDMVRHECAEALGSIATVTCNEILEGFVEDKDRVVRESVEVALDILEYTNNNEIRKDTDYLVD